MSEIREPGWYWVKPCANCQWEPAMLEDGFFELDRDLYKPSALEEIGPRIPLPDEPWQMVPKRPNQDMIDAFNNVQMKPYTPHAEVMYRGKHAYQAMLAAAPKPGGE